MTRDAAGELRSQPRHLRVIVNPQAGRGRAARLVPTVRSLLGALPCVYHVEHATSLEDARRLARAAHAAGEVAVGMGGDGLVTAVAGELRGPTPGTLGIIPTGRGNDFARKLKIPSEIAQACELLVNGVPVPTDVAQVNGVPYLGIASVGIDSDTQLLANMTRLPLGKYVYVYAGYRTLATWKPAEFRVVADGRPMVFRGYSVAVANSGIFGGGMLLSPSSRLDDGVLEIVVLEDMSRLRYAGLIRFIFKGTLLQQPKVRIFRARTVTVDSDRPFGVYADGDPVAQLPAAVQVDQAAIRVIVPRVRA